MTAGSQRPTDFDMGCLFRSTGRRIRIRRLQLFPPSRAFRHRHRDTADFQRVEIEPRRAGRSLERALDLQVGERLTHFKLMRHGRPSVVARQPLRRGGAEHREQTTTLQITRTGVGKPVPTRAARFLARAPDAETRPALPTVVASHPDRLSQPF